MNRITRVLAAAAIVATAGSAAAQPSPRSFPVGVQVAGVADVDGKTFAVGIWYPADVGPTPPVVGGAGKLGGVQDAPIAGRGLPLVVIRTATAEE
jgi:hypothetical protein